jgi:hypothetical protein
VYVPCRAFGAGAVRVSLLSEYQSYYHCPTTGLAGSVNVTGWALSVNTVARVAVYRDPVPGESGLVYVQDASFVAGSRPDVASAYPGYPHNDWGFGTQLLTNSLPDSNGDGGKGNGTYRLHGIAFDPNGLNTDFGQVTITVDNRDSHAPFGTIDTPSEGGTASGTSYVNLWEPTWLAKASQFPRVRLHCRISLGMLPDDRLNKDLMKYIVFLYLVVLAQTSSAQNSLQVLGAGYALPGHLIAPGQIVTLFVAGAKTVLPSNQQIQQATTIPFPTNLAGFSASISQYTFPSPQLLPILSVQQVNNCRDQGTRQTCIVTALTVQIPTPPPDTSGGDTFGILPTVQISVIENGTTSDSFYANLAPQVVHVLTTCDSLSQVVNQCPLPCRGISSCSPKITHADGTIVSPESPANVGETLVLYAVGLGDSTPPVQVNAVTPTPAPVPVNSKYIMMQYSYLIDPEALPSPLAGPAVPASVTFSGLTPGEIGLYQVNFKVPAPSANASNCYDPKRLTDNSYTNLTLVLTGVATTDSVKICVKLPGRTVMGDPDGQAAGTDGPGTTVKSKRGQRQK